MVKKITFSMLFIMMISSTSFGQSIFFGISHFKSRHSKIKKISIPKIPIAFKQRLDSTKAELLWNGEWVSEREEYIYDDSGHLLQNPTYRHTNNSDEYLFYKSEYDYDDHGNIISEIFYEENQNDPSELIGQSKFVKSYEGNKLVEDIQYAWDTISNDWIDSHKSEISYENDVLSSIVEFSRENDQWNPQEKATFSFDENQQILEQKYLVWENNAWQIDFSILYSYNDFGQRILAEETYFDEDPNGILEGKTEYTYDGQGRLKLEQYTEFDEGQWLDGFKYELTYDEQGNIANFISHDSFGSGWVGFQKIQYDYNNDFLYNELLLPFFVFDEIGDYEEIITDKEFSNHMITKYTSHMWNEDTNMWEVDDTQEFFYSGQEITSSAEILTSDICTYPNPASDFFIFKTDMDLGIDFELLDIQGREIISKKVNSNEKIDIRHLKSGMYFYQAKSDDSTFNGKLIKY